MTNSIILGSEEFRQIYDSDYYVSRDGLVVNNKTHYIIKPSITPLGYVVFHISIKGKRIQKYAQRLVWETYIGKVPNGYDIDHIDNNKLNNKLDNLRCITHKENCYKRDHIDNDGAPMSGRFDDKHPRSKKVLIRDYETGKLIGEYKSTMDVERNLRIPHSQIIKLCNKKYATSKYYSKLLMKYITAEYAITKSLSELNSDEIDAFIRQLEDL